MIVFGLIGLYIILMVGVTIFEIIVEWFVKNFKDNV
jgi:hypothetical protein